MVRTVLSSLVSALMLTLLGVAILNVTSAQVRSSTNYQLQSDSINVGGGLSTSTNFSQESTVGEIATGRSTSTNYQLRAGYQQMQEVFLSMTAAADVIMDTAIGGITGGTSNGSTSVTVTTDSPSGYNLSIAATNNPAMRSGSNVIQDYPATVTPDYDFLVSAGEAYFGFSVLSPDVVARFRNNASNMCNAGVQNNPDQCWRGLSTADVVVSESNASNQPGGTETTIQFRVGLGGSNSVPAGEYVATTTLTALPL